MLNRRTHRLGRGYSIAEIVISMALIVLLTVAGFTACYAALAVQGRADENMQAWNGAGTVREAFVSALHGGIEGDTIDERARSVTEKFGSRLGFALNATVFGLHTVTFDGAGWQLSAVMEADVRQEGTVGEDGQLTETEIQLPRRGLVLSYGGRGTGKLTYEYYSTELALTAEVTVTSEGCDMTVTAYASVWSDEAGRYVADGSAICAQEAHYEG